MPSRKKRLEKSIESLKEQIEAHFEKLEKDIEAQNQFTARYHIKELDLGLIADLERRMIILGKIDKTILEAYRKRLDEIKEKLNS